MNEKSKRRTFRFRAYPKTRGTVRRPATTAGLRIGYSLRTLLIFVTLAAPTLAYFASYYRLSRRGMADAEPWGSEDWVYISAAEAQTKDAQSLHLQRARFYAPLNYLDNRLFGTPTPSPGWMERMTEASE